MCENNSECSCKPIHNNSIFNGYCVVDVEMFANVIDNDSMCLCQEVPCPCPDFIKNGDCRCQVYTKICDEDLNKKIAEHIFQHISP